MSKPVQTKAFAPVRLTEGREWIDTHSLRCIRDMAKDAAARCDLDCGPGWKAANPVVRIVQVLVAEVQE